MAAGLLHVVVYETKPGVDAAKRARVEHGFQVLADAIDGVELVSMGRNESPSRFAQGWTFAAALRLRDRALLKAYLAHPAHQALTAETAEDFFDRCVVIDLPVGDANPRRDDR